ARLGRRGRAGRSPDLHESTLAPAGGVHCPRAHQPRGPTLDHAPPHPGGNGRAGARGRLRKTLSGDRPVGDLHRLGRPARWRLMALPKKGDCPPMPPTPVTGDCPLFWAKPRLMIKAAVTAVLLCGLFLLVYSSTNWFTSRRGDV